MGRRSHVRQSWKGVDATRLGAIVALHHATDFNSDTNHKTCRALLVQYPPKTLEEAGDQVPSHTWMSLQFYAKNPLAGRALNYTGALGLSHKVHQRTLWATSIDSHYVSAGYKCMQSYELWVHDLLQEALWDMLVISASWDDNCKVLPPPSFLPIEWKVNEYCSG